MMAAANDSAHGTIELQEHELDVILMADGSWIGPGAVELTYAIEVGAFRWPRRIDRLRLMGVVIQVGDIHLLASWLNQDVRAAYRHLDEYWPESERQSIIPTSMPFRLDLSPGAHIQGRLLTEEQAPAGPFPSP